MHEIQVFDPFLFQRRLKPLDDDFMGVDSAEANRGSYYSRLAADERGGMRYLLAPDDATITRLLAIERDMPNFAQAIGVIIRAATLAKASGAPFSVPPILLAGPPGVGKTTFARAVAKALVVPFEEIVGPSLDDPGCLVGRSMSWKGARAGIIARSVLETDFGCPLIFVDEIDKAPPFQGADPLDVLHAATEPHAAAEFRDAWLEVPIRADHIVWIAAANSLSGIRASLIDRFLIVPVNGPEEDAAQAIVAQIFRSVAEPYQSMMDEGLDTEIATFLIGTAPRKVRIILTLAMGFAAAKKGSRLTLANVKDAFGLVVNADSKPIMGFHTFP